MKISLVSHLAGQKGGHYTDYANKICESLFKQNIDFKLFVARGYTNKYFEDNNKSPSFAVKELDLEQDSSPLRRLFSVVKFYLKSLSFSNKSPVVFFDSLPPPFELFLLPFVIFVRPGTNNIFFVLHRNPFSKQTTIPRSIYYGFLSFTVYLLSKRNVNFLVHVKEMISQIPFRNTNFHYINYGVSTSESFSQNNKTKDGFNLLFFGGVVPQKGIVNLVRAVRETEAYQVFLTIAGKVSDSFKDELLTEIQGTKNIDLRLGYLDEDEIPKLFSDHDCLILPYKKGWNATSGPLHQAIEFNLPVIVTDVPQLSYIVNKHKIGLVSEGHDVFNLSKAIINMKHRYSNFHKQLSVSREKLSYDNLAKNITDMVGRNFAKER